MKALINSTTILSLALYVVPPFAAQAQDLQSVMVGDQTVICLPDKSTPCPDGAFCVVAKKPKNCQANAEKAVAKAQGAASGGDQATSDQATGDQAATDQAAADQAAADKAAADKAAADQAAADQAAADKAAADKAAADQAAADQAAADKAAADKAAADQAAADQAAADKAAADKAAADQAAADQAAADKAAADKAAADQAAADQAAADKAAADQAAADQTAGDTGTADQSTADATGQKPLEPFKTVTTASGREVICLPDKAAVCPEGQLCVVAVKKAKCLALAEKKVAKLDQSNADQGTAEQGTAQPQVDPHAQDQGTAAQPATDQGADQAAATQSPEDKAAAEKAAAEQAAMDAANIAAAKKAEEEAAAKAAADPNLKPVEAPKVEEEAAKTLETVLAEPATPAEGGTTEPAPVVAAATEEKTDLTKPPAEQPAPKDATVTTETVTEADTRSSSQDFAAAPVEVAPGKKSHLSDLEKVGLVALGALAIGAMINGNKQQVVSNTGDRVVVKQQDGSYQVYKDDNSLLREPGAKVTTTTFKDGSTRSVVTRQDGSQIATIRDASGRVLQRVAYDTKGKATILIDDLKPEPKIDVTKLPKPQPSNRISVDDQDAKMRAALAAAQAEDVGQKFSLRQIRTIAQVRYLAPTIDINNITFETGSAAIQPSEARKLNKLGAFITQMIDDNPGEVFLIEGHTDAVGSAASNLALSDRRAESVAKALTEYFEVPPENLVVQGYGETELVVDTQGDERANRRVAVRIITPLLQQDN